MITQYYTLVTVHAFIFKQSSAHFPVALLTVVLSKENSHGPLGGVVHERGGDEQAVPGRARRLPHAAVVLHDAGRHALRARAPQPRLLRQRHLAHGQAQALLLAHEVLQPETRVLLLCVCTSHLHLKGHKKGNRDRQDCRR